MIPVCAVDGIESDYEGGMTMQYRRLGDSELFCSVLGFGTWEMGTTQYGFIEVGEARDAVHCALDLGINLFDTAEYYGPGHSEVLLGQALGKRREDAIIVTKVGFTFDKDGEINGLDTSRRHILSATEGCLKRLNTDWIDMLLIHWSDHRTPAAESIGALEELRQAGKIRYYGVSNYSVAMMKECEQHGHLVTNQIGYNMYDRRVESQVLPYCQQTGTGFMGYGTLAYGLLTGTWTERTTFPEDDWRSEGWCFGLPLFERENVLMEVAAAKRLKALALEHGRSLPQLAIAWAIGNPSVSASLVGMRNPAEVSNNVEAADWQLTPEIKGEIDRIFHDEGVPTYVDAEIAVHVL
jgi:aryl-alcohol dehydrogenase-like predicted oxidoreductase